LDCQRESEFGAKLLFFIVYSLSPSSSPSPSLSLSQFSIQVSLLIPTNLGSSDHAHLKFSVTSLDINQIEDQNRKVTITSSSSSKFHQQIFFAKSIDMRGASLSVSSASLKWTKDGIPDYEVFVRNEAADVLLSPSHLSVQIHGRKEMTVPINAGPHSSTELSGARRIMSIKAQLSNLELTPTFAQIHLIRDAVMFLHLQHISFLHRSVARPALQLSEAFASYDSIPPEIRSSRREWWRFVIQAVIVMVRNKRSTLSRMTMRRNYVALYKKVVLHKIKTLEDDEIKKTFESGLDTKEENTLDELHHYFGLHDLLLFRFNVLKSLRTSGTSVATLRLALDRQHDYSDTFWSFFRLQKRDLPDAFQFQKISPGKKCFIIFLHSEILTISFQQNESQIQSMRKSCTF